MLELALNSIRAVFIGGLLLLGLAWWLKTRANTAARVWLGRGANLLTAVAGLGVMRAGLLLVIWHAELSPQPLFIVWDTNPDTVVLRAGPYKIDYYSVTYTTWIWGDGRIIWSANCGAQEGRLSWWQMRNLLAQAAQVVRPPNPVSSLSPGGGISLNVAGWNEENILSFSNSSLEKLVEHYRGKDEGKFYIVYDDLLKGAGAAGVPYNPESRYLIAYSQTGLTPPVSSRQWPAAQFGFPLSQAMTVKGSNVVTFEPQVVHGKWISGEALEFVETALNDHTDIQDGNIYYRLTLFPRVSPAQCQSEP